MPGKQNPLENASYYAVFKIVNVAHNFASLRGVFLGHSVIKMIFSIFAASRPKIFLRTITL